MREGKDLSADKVEQELIKVNFFIGIITNQIMLIDINLNVRELHQKLRCILTNITLSEYMVFIIFCLKTLLDKDYLGLTRERGGCLS